MSTKIWARELPDGFPLFPVRKIFVKATPACTGYFFYEYFSLIELCSLQKNAGVARVFCFWLYFFGLAADFKAACAAASRATGTRGGEQLT